MKLTIVHILLFFILLMAYQCASAQDYVITVRGDSLSGDVRPLFFGAEKKVQLTTADDKTLYSITEVRAFAKDGEVFHPIRGERGYEFMKLLQPGYLSLYAYQMENQMRFDGLWLQKRDGAHLIVPNLGFRKYISQFLEDCPNVADKVKEGQFTRRDLTEIIDAYNSCIGQRTAQHVGAIAQLETQNEKVAPWQNLEDSIQKKEFADKGTALEMVAEIRKKIRDNERIPNFLIEGLKGTLNGHGLDDELKTALQTLD
jgi:hypothetical protein